MNLLKQTRELANALSRLCYCYKPEDEAVLLEGIQSLMVSYKDDGWHGAFMDVEDLLENQSAKINSFIFIYMHV